MARELRGWIAATLAACGAIILGYVPPRGAPEPPSRSRAFAPSAARERAQELEWQWRAADLALRLTEYRTRLEAALAQRRASEEPGPLLVLDAPRTLPQAIERRLTAGVDSAWRALGLGVTKVSVGVILDFHGAGAPAGPSTPRREFASPAYLLPDSTDRTDCIALVPAAILGRILAEPASPDTPARLEQWWRHVDLFGPCAFEAAFGTPSRPVRHWLAYRDWDLALVADWNRTRPEGEFPWVSESVIRRPDSWFWGMAYRGLESPALGCLGGRAERCRDAVLAGAGGAVDDPVPAVVHVMPWWRRRERLLEGGSYLSDVARAVGHDRFERFWGSLLPVDTALAAAVKMPIGRWTERREHHFAPRLPLGAAAPVGAAVLGVLLVGGALWIAAWYAGRREAR